MDLLQIDTKVRDELKERINIVTSESTNSLRKLCFFGPKKYNIDFELVNSNKRSRIESYISKNQSSILSDYFKPLIEYSNGIAYTNTILNQPLWFNRQQMLTKIDFKQELNKLINENDDISFLAKCVDLSLKKTISYSQLSDENQNELKRLSSLSNNFSTSLLVTFLIRDDDLRLRNKAAELLKNGRSSLDASELKLFEEKIDLIKITFIDLTNAKFTNLDINGIDFSGQNLNGLIAQQTSINNVKFNCCSLEYSNFQSSTLTQCYFNQSNLFKSNLAFIKPATSCHFEVC